MLSALWPLLAILIELAIKTVFIVLVLLRRRPASVTLAWIVVILILPLIGAVLYLLVGEVRIGKRRIARHEAIVARIQSSLPFSVADIRARDPEIPQPFKPIAILAEAVGENDALGGNLLRLIGDPDLFIQALVEDIEAAEHHCHLLTYIYLVDHSGTRVAQAMMRAARRGVACRVLADAVGSKLFLRSALRREMERAGVLVVAALPTNALRMLLSRLDLRNHRKLVVIDGVVGYTGSQNIADAQFAIKARYAPWVDAMVRIEGPVVWDLQVLFVEDWFLDTGESLEDLLGIQPLAQADGVIAQVVGSGPSTFNAALRQMNHAAFHLAREELIVTTPYFVPDDATLTALCTAGRRGVETSLVVPARNDSPIVAAASRSHYADLLESGVRIYEYQGGLLHAKTVTVDRDLAVVSTANLDRRSFELNFEVTLLVYDDDFASQLRFLQSGYIAASRPVDANRWRLRRAPLRLIENAAGTLSPLL